MSPAEKRLLIIDAAVNLVLGMLLLLFPAGIVALLGLPPTNTDFYASILGAVLFGIGIALLIERYGASRNIRGLGFGGCHYYQFLRCRGTIFMASSRSF